MKPKPGHGCWVVADMRRKVDVSDVVGLAEACEIIGLSDARVGQLERDDPAFPERLRVNVRATPLFLRSELEFWKANRVKRKPGRPSRNQVEAIEAVMRQMGGGAQ